MEEFRLHAAAAPHAGVTDAEIDELLFQIVAYAADRPASRPRRVIRPRCVPNGKAG